jgi:hypothetical protein
VPGNHLLQLGIFIKTAYCTNSVIQEEYYYVNGEDELVDGLKTLASSKAADVR